MGVRFLDEPVATKSTGRVRFLDEPAASVQHDPTSLEPPKETKSVPMSQQNSNPVLDAIRGFYKGGSLGVSEKVLAGANALQNQYKGKPLNIWDKGPESLNTQQFKTDYQANRAQQKVEPKSVAGTAGEIASYFTPGTAPSAIFKGATKLVGAGSNALKNVPRAVEGIKAIVPGGMGTAKVVKSAITGGVGAGASTGLQELVETGNASSALEQAGKGAAIGGVAGGILPSVAKILQAGGSKIFKSSGVLSRSKPGELKRNMESVVKNDLAGSVDKIVEKTSKKLNDLENQMQTVLKGNTTPINTTEPIEALRAKLLADPKYVTLGQKGINAIIKEAKANVSAYGDKGIMSVETANKVVRGLKANTKFVRGIPEKENIKAKVWNEIYMSLRNKISEVAPETKALNQQMSEIIPVQTAVEKLVDKAAQKPFLSLSDIVLGTGGLGTGAVLAVPDILKGDLASAGKKSLIPISLVLANKARSNPAVAANIMKAGGNVSKINNPQSIKSGMSLYDMLFGTKNVLPDATSNLNFSTGKWERK